MKEFKTKEEREQNRHWKTAIILVQDENGKVFVDNGLRHFKDLIDHAATPDDAMYMLGSALRQFEIAEIQEVIAAELKSMIEKAMA